jgi:hypothetical protein
MRVMPIERLPKTKFEVRRIGPSFADILQDVTKRSDFRKVS